VFLAIATIGFGEVVRLGFVNWSFTNGALGLVAIPQRTHIATIFLCLALALYLLGRLRGSRAGYALEAIREDETAARTMGIATTAYKLSMFVFGAALAGLAGGLEAHFTFMVSPSGYGFSRVIEMLVHAVVGGAALFFGPVVGAAFLTLLPELLRELGSRAGFSPGPFRIFLNGAILLVVILFLPNGLVSLPGVWARRKLRAREGA
jgi:branched-chain amino acid transport system permease protein